MKLGLKNSSANYTYLSLKRRKSDEKFYFTKMKKAESGGWEISETYDELTGILIDYNFSVFEWDKQEIKQLTLIFDVGDDAPKIHLDMNLNIISRSLMNTLMSMEKVITQNKPFKMSLYTNKAGYNAIVIREPDSTGKDGMYGWAFKPDELPAPEEIKIRNKPSIWDFTDLDEFLGNAFISSVGLYLDDAKSNKKFNELAQNDGFDDNVDNEPKLKKTRKK